MTEVSKSLAPPSRAGGGADEVRDYCADLSRDDLSFALATMHRLVHCELEPEFHRAIVRIAEFLGFEAAFYGYMKTAYRFGQSPHFVNLTAPSRWMEEYLRDNHFERDPVRVELERRLASGERSGFIPWDGLAPACGSLAQQVTARRQAAGVLQGGLAYLDAEQKDSVFLLSLGSQTRRPDRRTQATCMLLLTHLNSSRMKLDILGRINSLSEREKAVARWIGRGKSNSEIAKVMDLAESTVKFHATHIFRKLAVPNRQSAVSVLLAAQYLT